VPDEAAGPESLGAGRTELGQRLAGFIYGTIITLAVVVAGAKAYPADAGRIAVLVAVTSAVFWLAHVYAHGLGHSVAHDEHLSLAELRRIARRQATILEAAVPPLAALMLGALGVLSTRAAVWAALVLGVVVLVVQALSFARAERLGWLGASAVVAANLVLGMILVVLKLVVAH
jgi:hypothetical protein